MKLEAAIFKLWRDSASGGSIPLYRNVAPDSVGYTSWVSYKRIATDREKNLDGTVDSFTTATVVFTAWCPNEAALNTTINAIKDLYSGYKGTVGATKIHAILPTDEADLSDDTQKWFGRSLVFRVIFND